MSKLLCRTLSMLAMSCWVWAASAQAQTATLRTCEPAPTTTGLLTVESARTLSHLGFSVGVTNTYATDELLDITGTDEDADGPLRSRFVSTVAVGLGIVDRLEVTLALPISDVETATAGSTSSQLGLGDLRLRIKGAILGPDPGQSGIGLALVVDATAPTATENPFFGDDGLTVGGQLAVDYRTPAGLIVAINAGYRIRPEVSLDGLTLGNEIRGGLGLEVPLGWYGLSVIGELYGALQAVAQKRDPGLDEGRSLALEAMGAVRWRTPIGLTVSGGLGAGLSDDSFGGADYRVYFGLNYGGPQPERPDEALLIRYPDGTTSVAEAEPEDPDRAELDAAAAELDVPLPPPPKLDVEAFAALAKSDPDADADGIPIPTDACPDEPEDLDGHEDEDGCPDPDNDGDGVVDTADKCPLEKEVINGVDDEDGCPDEGESVVEATTKVIKINQKVEFRSGSAAMTGKGQRLLNQVARVMNANPHIWRFRVEGHTDNVGDSEFNVDLSERRARSVRAYLISRGVKPNRLEAKGLGATKPLSSNRTNRGRAANRRVEFHVVDKPDADDAPAPTPPGDSP